VRPRPAVALTLGLSSILAGFVVAAASRRADDLGVGGPPGVGWKQIAGMSLGTVLVVLGFLVSAAALRDRRLRSTLFAAEGRHLIAAFVLAFAVYVGAKAVMDPPIVGDQPHYMLETYSLVYDRDRDLRNDYGDPYRFWPVFRAYPDGHFAAGTGRPYSVHNVGLPALLTPAVLATHDPEAMQIELILVSAGAAALLLSILRRLPFSDRRWLVYTVWGLFVFSLPFLMHSAAAYPEMPAAFLALLAVRVLLEPTPRPVLLGAASVAAALLPWLHVRFTILGVAIVAALVVRAWQTYRRPAPVALVVAPPLVSHALLAVGFERWYGSPMLNAQYRGTDNEFSAPWAYRHSLGGLLSADYGWFPFAPLHLLALAGAVYLCLRYGRWAIAGCGVAMTYLALSGATIGAFTGYAYPARLQFVVVPFAAIAVLALLAGVPRLWPLAAALGVVTLLLTIDGLLDPDGLLPDDDPNAPGSPIARRLAQLWPSVVDDSGTGYPDWPHAILVLAASVGLGLILSMRPLLARRLADRQAASAR
jgi:hypothetical protein